MNQTVFVVAPFPLARVFSSWGVQMRVARHDALPPDEVHVDPLGAPPPLSSLNRSPSSFMSLAIFLLKLVYTAK